MSQQQQTTELRNKDFIATPKGVSLLKKNVIYFFILFLIFYFAKLFNRLFQNKIYTIIKSDLTLSEDNRFPTDIVSIILRILCPSVISTTSLSPSWSQFEMMAQTCLNNQFSESLLVCTLTSENCFDLFTNLLLAEYQV